MNRSWLFICSLAFLNSIPGYAQQHTKSNRDEDERAIREIEALASEALATKDLEKLVSLYADDAALFHEHDSNIRGRAAIRATWTAVFARPGFTIKAEPRTVETSDDGELAWAHGVYTATTNDAAGKLIRDHGEYALVYKKQADGKWKIIADNGTSDLRTHSLPKPPTRRSPFAPFAPLVGMACFLSGLWFLFGMPVVAAVYLWKYFRTGKLSVGLLVAIVMLIVFYGTGILLWTYFSRDYWNLSFLTALKAAGDAARYGHPVEHTAQSLLVALLVLSTLSAGVAGIISGAARGLWARHRRLAS